MNLPIKATAKEDTCSTWPTGNSRLNAGKQANIATTSAIAVQAFDEYRAAGAEDRDSVVVDPMVVELILRFFL
jgi:hypothetical protein